MLIDSISKFKPFKSNETLLFPVPKFFKATASEILVFKLIRKPSCKCSRVPINQIVITFFEWSRYFGLIVTFTSPPARLLCTSTGRKINCSPSSSINSTFDNAGNKCRIQINFCKPLPWLDTPNKLILFKLWQIMDPIWSSSFESESFASPCCPSIQEIFALCKILYWASPNHHLHYPSRRHL